MTKDEKGRNQSAEIKSKQCRMVFVCEERNDEVEEQLSKVAESIFQELLSENLLSFLKQSEANMYKTYGKCQINYSLIYAKFLISYELFSKSTFINNDAVAAEK